MNVSFTDLAYARKRLRRFLESPAAQHQTFALMAMTTTRTLLVHDFTTSNAALIDALEHLPAAMPAAADSSTFVDSERAQDNLIKSVAVLESVAHALSFSPAHVNLFWITSGFPTLSPIDASSDTQATFDQVLRHASNLYLNARMTIYTIDSHGVEWIDSLPNHTQPGASGSRADSNAFLRASNGGGNDGDQVAGQQNNLASNRAIGNSLLGAMDARTGGRAFSNVNDIDVPLTEALADGSSLYTVAYSPADRNFNGAFRRITVEIRRPGLVARTREGYYALANPAETNPVARRAQLASALENPLRFHALDVSGELAGSNSHPSLRVHVAAPDVEWTYSDRGAEVVQTIVVAAYSRTNRPLTSREWRVSASRPDPATTNPEFVYTLPFDLPAGTVRIRLVVADDTGSRMGTNEIPLTPPH